MLFNSAKLFNIIDRKYPPLTAPFVIAVLTEAHITVKYMITNCKSYIVALLNNLLFVNISQPSTNYRTVDLYL